MDLTLGVPDVVGEPNIDEILSDIRTTTAEEVTARFNASIKDMRQRHKKEKSELRGEYEERIRAIEDEKEELWEHVKENQQGRTEFKERVEVLERKSEERERQLCTSILESINEDEKSARQRIRWWGICYSNSCRCWSSTVSLGSETRELDAYPNRTRSTGRQRDHGSASV